MEDIQARILEKQKEMRLLEEQMQRLNQERLRDLYPGRCFQYCIDREIATQEELANLPKVKVQAKAEKVYFSEIARGSRWPCGNDECEGWDTTTETCPCGAKRFYWLYEESLSLGETTIIQGPAASPVTE